MALGRVLVVGLDPVRIPGWDPKPVVAAITRIRKHEPLLEFFEKVVNLVRQHAPGAAIAFNSSPEDTADAALRWLR